VIPLVAAFNVGSIMSDALDHPETAAADLVNLSRVFNYSGINLDLEPLDCPKCRTLHAICTPPPPGGKLSLGPRMHLVSCVQNAVQNSPGA
jgi:hypothetical protein